MDNPNADLISGLRQLADFLEERPLREICQQTFHVFGHTPEEFAEQLRIMGTADKSAGSGFFFAKRKFGQKVELHLCIEREQVCERVKIGERIVPAEPERIIAATPERVEEVYEYRCPESILALAEKASEA